MYPRLSCLLNEIYHQHCVVTVHIYALIFVFVFLDNLLYYISVVRLYPLPLCIIMDLEAFYCACTIETSIQTCL